MIPHSMIFEIERSQDRSKHLELSAFAEKLVHFKNLLTRSIKIGGHDGVTLEIFRLSYSSPITIGCQPVKNGEVYIPLVTGFRENMDSVQFRKGKDIDEKFLILLEELTSPKPGKIQSSKIIVMGETSQERYDFDLNDRFLAKIGGAQRQEYSEISEIDGVLEEINIHGATYSCRIYNAGLPPASIKCEFAKELLSIIQSALGKRVSVSGEFFYKNGREVPHKIQTKEIEILLSDEESPSLSDLEGKSPGLTGDKTAEEFVRQLRDEW